MLCGDWDHSAVLKYQDVIDLHTENRGEDNEVVNGRQSRTALPLVNGLGRGESENILHVLYGQTRGDPHAGDVDPGGGHVDDRYPIHFIYSPIPAVWPVTHMV